MSLSHKSILRPQKAADDINLTERPTATSARRVRFDAQSTFLQLCQQGDFDDPKGLSRLREYLSPKSGAALDVNQVLTPQQSLTPLHVACTHGQADVVRLLLSLPGTRASKVNAQDTEGWTPLHCASAEGHLEIIEILGCCRGRTLEDGSQVLATSAKGTLETVYYPVDGPLVVKALNYDNESAFDVASSGNSSRIKLLLSSLGKQIPPRSDQVYLTTPREEVDESSGDSSEDSEDSAECVKAEHLNLLTGNKENDPADVPKMEAGQHRLSSIKTSLKRLDSINRSPHLSGSRHSPLLASVPLPAELSKQSSLNSISDDPTFVSTFSPDIVVDDEPKIARRGSASSEHLKGLIPSSISSSALPAEKSQSNAPALADSETVTSLKTNQPVVSYPQTTIPVITSVLSKDTPSSSTLGNVKISSPVLLTMRPSNEQPAGAVARPDSRNATDQTSSLKLSALGLISTPKDASIRRDLQDPVAKDSPVDSSISLQSKPESYGDNTVQKALQKSASKAAPLTVLSGTKELQSAFLRKVDSPPTADVIKKPPAALLKSNSSLMPDGYKVEVFANKQKDLLQAGKGTTIASPPESVSKGSTSPTVKALVETAIPVQDTLTRKAAASTETQSILVQNVLSAKHSQKEPEILKSGIVASMKTFLQTQSEPLSKEPLPVTSFAALASEMKISSETKDRDTVAALNSKLANDSKTDSSVQKISVFPIPAALKPTDGANLDASVGSKQVTPLSTPSRFPRELQSDTASGNSTSGDKGDSSLLGLRRSKTTVSRTVPNTENAARIKDGASGSCAADEVVRSSVPLETLKQRFSNKSASTSPGLERRILDAGRPALFAPALSASKKDLDSASFVSACSPAPTEAFETPESSPPKEAARLTTPLLTASSSPGSDSSTASKELLPPTLNLTVEEGKAQSEVFNYMPRIVIPASRKSESVAGPATAVVVSETGARQKAQLNRANTVHGYGASKPKDGVSAKSDLGTSDEQVDWLELLQRRRQEKRKQQHERQQMALSRLDSFEKEVLRSGMPDDIPSRIPILSKAGGTELALKYKTGEPLAAPNWKSAVSSVGTVGSFSMRWKSPGAKSAAKDVDDPFATKDEVLAEQIEKSQQPSPSYTTSPSNTSTESAIPRRGRRASNASAAPPDQKLLQSITASSTFKS